jgi:hypothetical protein
MQNVHFIYRPYLHVLSNGALLPVVLVSHIRIMHGKKEETIHGNCPSIQLAFLGYRTGLTGVTVKCTIRKSLEFARDRATT